MKRVIRAAAAAAFVLAAGSVSAATVFQDNFSRSSNMVGNGWSELERYSSSVRTFSNDVLLLGNILSGTPDAAAASAVIDATGFENLTISFKWKSYNKNEYADKLTLSWASDPAPLMTNQNAWTQLYRGNDGGTNWHIRTRSLAAADNSMFNIMFWTKVSSSNEGFALDYVKITGDAISAVPLPATGFLLIAGLGGLGALRRKKKS
ncbi:hypothetical protein DL239_07780 [Sedimentitalea sp. CY04]|uniref:Ice-binding protein C-terminal domain-containing protein n=1 Tax=Parasedimentitalea denitrificans TaxID=2211118 RepID=A0ABX0W9N9_9RHOB|nr:VPLPA-CTERM sorting domain-containing protein [Sedimentitalea sp. CY04]NIZ60871.1 hypothetical protein [Sedimentitalea sp. CY04]